MIASNDQQIIVWIVLGLKLDMERKPEATFGSVLEARARMVPSKGEITISRIPWKAMNMTKSNQTAAPECPDRAPDQQCDLLKQARDVAARDRKQE